MKQNELKPCRRCGRGVMAGGVPLFYRITVERFGVDLNAVRRQAGLEMMLGNPTLAAVMGPDDDLAKPIGEPVRGLLCATCAHDPALTFLELTGDAT